jgi:hypothetical protein
MLSDQVVVSEFGWKYIGILADDNHAMDTTNTDSKLEMTRDVEHKTLHRIGSMHAVLEIRQGHHNLCAIHKECHDNNKQITARQFISDTNETIKLCWSNFQHDGTAQLKFSHRPPVPAAWCAKYFVQDQCGNGSVLPRCSPDLDTDQIPGVGNIPRPHANLACYIPGGN